MLGMSGGEDSSVQRVEGASKHRLNCYENIFTLWFQRNRRATRFHLDQSHRNRSDCSRAGGGRGTAGAARRHARTANARQPAMHRRSVAVRLIAILRAGHAPPRARARAARLAPAFAHPRRARSRRPVEVSGEAATVCSLPLQGVFRGGIEPPGAP